MPCPCRVPSGRFPAAGPVSAPPFWPNRHTASAASRATESRGAMMIGLSALRSELSSGIVPAQATTCNQRIGLVGPAVKSGVGRPLAPFRTSSRPSLPVYCRDTHHPQITHTSPAHHPQRSFPAGWSRLAPNRAAQHCFPPRIRQPLRGGSADAVTPCRFNLPTTITCLAAPRKGKFGPSVQVVAAIEA